MSAALLMGQRLLASVPRWLWGVVVVLVLLAAARHWHEGQLKAARVAAAAAQAERDRAAIAQASSAADERQRRLVADLARRQKLISKGSNDALAREHDDLVRRYDALRLRWAAARAAPAGGAAGAAAALSRPAAGVDDAACAARGWVDFNTAAAAAQAADTAIAKDDAWIAWARAQAAAWPETGTTADNF